jgi:hypothetical protein
MIKLEISCIYLGVLSTEIAAREKFILADDGTLLFGRVLYHKELALYQFGRDDIRVVAAGVIPDGNVSDLESWGWKSTGYGIITDQELRPNIVNKILKYRENLKYNT